MHRALGFLNLVFDVVEQTSNLAQRTHDGVVERTIKRFPPIEPVKEAAAAVAGIEGLIATTVFKSIRGANEIARASVNGVAGLAEKALPQPLEHPEYALVTPMDSSAAGSANWCVDYAQSAVNGFWGDHLLEKGSGLATPMTLRHQGRVLEASTEALAQAYPEATNKVCVFVHGLASTEWLWNISSAEHYEGDVSVSYGSRLHNDLGYTPVYVRYNTGRHISQNGLDLSALLNELCEAYPCDIEEIVLVGHSMGGLVARSAAHHGREDQAAWVDMLRHVACIGAPNLGAPLEKAVHLLTGVLRKVDAAGAQVPAELLNSRSSGVKDLRYGYTHADEWQGKDPDAPGVDDRLDLPPLEGVGYYFFAATISETPEHPLGKLLGDLLVRIPSASGEAGDEARRIPFSGGKVFPGMNHLHIVNHPDIYAQLRDFLSPTENEADCQG